MGLDADQNRSSIMMRKVHKSIWLWLTFISFGMLLTFTVLEVSYYYPSVKAYFDNSGTLAARNLAARSRYHLTETLELVSRHPHTEENNEQAKEDLDIAYGLMDIGLHRTEYACVEGALEAIDTLYKLLEQSPPVHLPSYNQRIYSVIQCTEEIQIALDNKRAKLANDMLDELTFQVQVLVIGTLFIMLAGAVTLSIHRKQSRLINEKGDEARKWIQHAMEDALTGAGNRRALDEARAKINSSNTIYSVLMCDLDYFKQYNDRYGHLAGDKALTLIAEAISTLLRDKDTLYRYGGEELVVVLPNTQLKEAQAIAARILNLIRKLELPHSESEHKVVTVSIGCAANNEKMYSEDLILLADKRLYEAKRAGRNTIYPDL